jgi:lysophospholipase L1-like esterase
MVITIGDSYAAGDGAHAWQKHYDDPYCYVEDDTTPGGKYASARGLKHIVAACSGDLINETVAQWDDLQLRYADEATDLWEGSVIIVTTGGNSLKSIRGDDFVAGLVRCLAVPRCYEDAENQVANYDAVQTELELFYSQLAIQANGATVRVIGYPKVFNSNRFRCSIPGITVREADFFDNIVIGMNDRIIAAIDAVKSIFSDFDVRFVDVTKYYTNGACSPFKSRQVRNLNVRFPRSSFHPTQNGYDKSYKALLDTMIG